MLSHASTKTLALNGSTATYTVTGGITNGGTGFAQFDTIGFDYAAIDVILSPSNTTSNAPSLVKLSESDVTCTAGSTSLSDVTVFYGATATGTNVGFLVPVTGVSTANNNTYRMNVDTRPRKRYLSVTVNPVTTMSMIVDARLGRAEALPVAASTVGVQALAEG